MQQFVVPQFIDVEAKIIGPITVRQFLVILVGGSIIFLAFRFADFLLFMIIFACVGGLTLLFAFAKPGGQLFHYFLLNIVQSVFLRPTLRVWDKTPTKEDLEYFRISGIGEVPQAVEEKKEVRRERIRDLSLVVNTGGYYRGDE
jgi:membrane protein implicated in regulation of membrane protease activity